jgi:hypothetical protein
MLTLIKDLFYKIAWPPIGILVLHNALSKLLGHPSWLDPPMHFLGGAAIAYFFYEVLLMKHTWFGKSKPLAHLLLAFCLAVTVAVFWEFLEFAGDKITGSHVQISLEETMYDLLLGSSGAMAFLLIRGIVKRVTTR